jgi:hypothetical protein
MKKIEMGTRIADNAVLQKAREEMRFSDDDSDGHANEDD